MLGGLLNVALLKKHSSTNNAYLGLGWALLMTLFFLLLSLAGSINPWTIIVLTFGLMIGGGLCFPNLYAVALSTIPEHIQGVQMH